MAVRDYLLYGLLRFFFWENDDLTILIYLSFSWRYH